MLRIQNSQITPNISNSDIEPTTIPLFTFYDEASNDFLIR
jgi:hypothetical protein